MATWDKMTALAELNSLKSELRAMSDEGNGSEEHVRWIMKTRRFLSEVFGEDSDYYQSVANLQWNHSGGLIGGVAHREEVFDPQLGFKRLQREAFRRSRSIALGLLGGAQDELQSSTLDEVYHGKDTAPEASMLVSVMNLAQHKLRKTMRVQPANEVEVQDAFETLLIGADVPYSRETESIEYSTKTYRPDFTVVRADLAIEMKICKDAAREKALPAEINDDILAYQQKYGNMLFVIYDLGHIRDVERFVASFEEHDGVIAKVVKH